MAFSRKPPSFSTPILTKSLVQASGSGSDPGTSAFAAAPVRPKTPTTTENAVRSRTPQHSGRETDDSNRLCHVANRSNSSSSSDNVCRVANPDSVSDTVSSDVVESESSSESGPSCSGRDATRFMDKNTFAFRQLSLNPVPKIISKFVHKYGTAPPTDVQSIMQKLHKARNEEDRQHTLQIIQAGLLPKLKSDHNLKELAQCLKVNDLDIQVMATTYLQAQLFHLDDRDNPALTEELLMVAKTTQETFCQGSDTDSHVHVLGYIHLLSVCALVSRNLKPSAEQCNTLVFSSAPDKKKDSVPSDKTLMARAFNVFYKHFHHSAVQGKGWPIPVWKNISWQESDRVHLKQSFEKMNECQQLVVVYSLLSELERTIQGDLTNRLVVTLSDLKDVLHKDKKKDKDKEAFRFAFDLMVVRGLVFLLNSAFREVMIQVGHSPGKEDHLQGIIDLLLSIIRGGDRRLKDETHVLPFHKVFQVRSAFSLLLFEDNQPQCLLAISYIKKYLQIFGFRMNTNVSLLGRTAMKQCWWYELDCFFVQNEARLIALVPKHTCLAKGPILDECVSDHVKHTTSGMKSKDRQILKMARCRQQNIKILVLLNSVDSLCEHILRLYAYQFSPFPFCITEPTQDKRLLQFLLSHRQQHKWLDRYTQQHILKDITDGLIFLKQNDIVLRDITTYNMLVEGRPEEGMSLTDILPSGKFTVKLADFGLAHEVTNPVYQHDTSMKVAAEDQGPVPCRWIPHEALRLGEYSEKSEVYALGCVTFEVSTHGCQPFTSYDRTISTEQLLLKILFDPESVSLHHWRCIPDDTFHFIRKCMHTKPEERPTLQNIATDLNTPEEDRTHIADSVHMGLILACDWHKQYPPISPDQLSRRHEPEKGIPAAVQRCIDDDGEMMVSYMNTQVESRRSVKKKSAMKKEELLTDDWMQIITLGVDLGTKVKEYVSEIFVSEVFATLEVIHLDGVDCWDNIYKNADTQQSDTTGLRLHERVYPYSIDLLSAAKSPELWDTVNLHDAHGDPDSENDIVHAKYIHVLISLTQRLMALHGHRLCHCDVRACNVLIDRKTGEVILPRLGRMRLLPDSQDHVSTVIHEDSLRWYPPEVTLGLDYEYAMCCTASDVYMLGMTFWETFNIREVVCADPAATEVNFVPFSNTPRDQVAGMSRQANSLCQPANCPDWMFELIKRCRHPDHASRPSCFEVLQELNRHCASAEHPHQPFWSGRWMPAADDGDTDSEPPALPKRRGGILDGVAKLVRRATKRTVSNRPPSGDRMSLDFSTLSLYETFPDIDETLPEAFMQRDRDPDNWILRSPETQKSRLCAWSASDGGYLDVTDIDSNIDYYSDGKWMPRPDYDQRSTAAESVHMLDRWIVPVQHRSRSHQKQDDQDDQDDQDNQDDEDDLSIPRPDYFEYSPQSRHAQDSECDTYQRPVSSADREQNGGQQQPARGRRLPLPKGWM